MNAEELYAAETAEKGLNRGYMRLSMTASWIISFMALGGCLWAVIASDKRHAYVVRIEPNGQTEVVAEGFQFKRQPAEVGYFLRNFCEDFFSRNRLTIHKLKATKWFFESALRDRLVEAWKEAKTVESVETNPVQVIATATDVRLTREGNEAYITVRLDRSSSGQKQEPQTYATTIRFECLACEGKPLGKDDDPSRNPLGFHISNIPTLEEMK